MDYAAGILKQDDDLAEWDRFVDTSPQGSVFSRSWWLRAVAEENFRILVLSKGGLIVAGMPFCCSRKLGIRIIRMPAMTQSLGVLLSPPEAGAKYETRLSKDMDVMKALIASIPRCASLTTRCHHSLTNWLPFYWAGYRQTTRYTYVLENLADMAAIYNNMSAKTRNIIKKAEKNGIRVAQSDDLDEFFLLVRKTFKRQGLASPYSESLIRRVFSACLSQGAGRLFLARDTDGRSHAGVLVVFDSKCMYYLIQGSDPDFRGSGAGHLAQWRSVEFASSVTASYDFEGSMISNIEHVFRSFGAAQKQFSVISKQEWHVAAAAALMKGVRKLLDR